MQLGPPVPEIYNPLRANTRERGGGKRLIEIERARDRESEGGGSDREKKRDYATKHIQIRESAQRPPR
jgi:hypothetical protein